MSLNCVLIGAGNLAWHLGTELQRNGFQVLQVYSRTKESAELLANRLNTCYCFNPEEIINDCDFFIVALKDDAVGEVLPKINFSNKLLIHCSGSLPIEILTPFSKNTGVLYPLQTFSKKRDPEFSIIPIFVEADSEDNLEIVKSIAARLSGNVHEADSEKRRSLHVAAVFACNFVNHLYSLSETLVGESGFSFDVLKPLIHETADKITNMHPKDAQTGPAVRFDKSVINKHLELLSDDKELAGLYKTISESIFRFHNKTE